MTATHKGLIDVDRTRLYQKILTTGDYSCFSYKMGWGEPAQICQAVMDKECPQCGATREEGFDMLFIAGELIGARCGACEQWSFGRDMPKSAPTLSSLKHKKRPRDNRRNANRRGYGSKWRKARLGQLRRYPLCAECLREGRTTVATVVDHIKPHKGNMKLFWDKDNWQSLCTPCHNVKTAKETGFGIW